jgi:hypothetical protein
MKNLTVQELIEQLQALVASGQVAADAWVATSGCDCNGLAGDVTVIPAERAPDINVYDDDSVITDMISAPGPVAFIGRFKNR